MRAYDLTGCINYARMQVSKISRKSLILKSTLFPDTHPILNSPEVEDVKRDGAEQVFRCINTTNTSEMCRLKVVCLVG